jgi:hypothetical protein
LIKILGRYHKTYLSISNSKRKFENHKNGKTEKLLPTNLMKIKKN